MALMGAATYHKGDDVGRGQVPKVQGEAIGDCPALKKETHRIALCYADPIAAIAACRAVIRAEVGIVWKSA
jgi:hypothetical protein